MDFGNNDKGIALVLDGGGGKGAYQIGVWEAMLKDTDFINRITAISGTSVGALNAVLFANGDFDVARDIWLEQVNNDIKQKDFGLAVENTKKFAELFGKSLVAFVCCLKSVALRTAIFATQIYNAHFNGSSERISEIERFLDTHFYVSHRISELIENEANNINLDKIRYCRMPIYVTATQYDKKALMTFFADKMDFCDATSSDQVRYIKLNGKSNKEILTALLASAALPAAFESQQINGERLRDGGIVDNSPIKPLYDEGYRHFLVVHCSKKAYIKNRDEKYPDAQFIEIFPSIQGKTLTFTHEQSQMLYECGIRDMTPVVEQNSFYRNLLSEKRKSQQEFDECIAYLEGDKKAVANHKLSDGNMQFLKYITSMLDD
ncbi:MAG: patatin-like phospholipase family protein [Oscillospiraceae bacterium]|nr:patatin-like phospholipase family protein [Oscillospiraceae bacterium]